MSGTTDQRKAQLDKAGEDVARVLNMSDEEIRAGIGEERRAKANAFLGQVAAGKCLHCGRPDAPHVTVDGPMCSGCLSACADV